MTSPSNSGNLNPCTVGPVRRDTQPTDQAWAYSLFPHRAVQSCWRQAYNTPSDMAAISVGFPASGAADDATAEISSSREVEFVTMAVVASASGLIDTAISQIYSQIDAAVGAIADKMIRTVLDALYAGTPPSGAPAGLAAAAAANPAGVLTPLGGASEPFSIECALCMLEALGVPRTPESPLYFLFPQNVYSRVLKTALAGGASGLVEFGQDPASGRRMLQVCGTGALLTQHCPPDRAYLAMMAGDRTTPDATAGFSFIHPVRNEASGIGGVDISVGPVTSDASTDTHRRLVTYGYALDLGSTGCVVGMDQIGA